MPQTVDTSHGKALRINLGKLFAPKTLMALESKVCADSQWPKSAYRRLSRANGPQSTAVFNPTNSATASDAEKACEVLMRFGVEKSEDLAGDTEYRLKDHAKFEKMVGVA